MGQQRERRLVVSLHGIKTRGQWQKMLSSPLSDAGFVPESLDYGNFLLLQMLWPPSRRRKVEWFRSEYQILTKGRELLPNLVAHSFGTYIAAEAMRRYPEIKFKRIIFCGSIVEQAYPWDRIYDRNQYSRLLNETGGRDLPVRLAEWIVSDAGPSGASVPEAAASPRSSL